MTVTVNLLPAVIFITWIEQESDDQRSNTAILHELFSEPPEKG